MLFPNSNPFPQQADDASGIHFSAGNGKMRLGSSPSLVSVSGTLSRVNTVASALKRFLSRDDSRPGSATPSEDQKPYRFPASASSASLTGNVGSATSAGKPPGSLRITQQVIEEVDEQATITSMRANEPRPNVMNIFAPTSTSAGTAPLQPPPAHSEPVDIPQRPPSYSRAQSQYEPTLFPPGGVDALLSTSAPAGGSPSMLSTAATAPSSPVGDSSKSLYDPPNAASRETGKSQNLLRLECLHPRFLRTHFNNYLHFQHFQIGNYLKRGPMPRRFSGGTSRPVKFKVLINWPINIVEFFSLLYSVLVAVDFVC